MDLHDVGRTPSNPTRTPRVDSLSNRSATNTSAFKKGLSPPSSPRTNQPLARNHTTSSPPPNWIKPEPASGHVSPLSTQQTSEPPTGSSRTIGLQKSMTSLSPRPRPKPVILESGIRADPAANSPAPILLPSEGVDQPLVFVPRTSVLVRACTTSERAKNTMPASFATYERPFKNTNSDDLQPESPRRKLASLGSRPLLKRDRSSSSPNLQIPLAPKENTASTDLLFDDSLLQSHLNAPSHSSPKREASKDIEHAEKEPVVETRDSTARLFGLGRKDSRKQDVVRKDTKSIPEQSSSNKKKTPEETFLAEEEFYCKHWSYPDIALDFTAHTQHRDRVAYELYTTEKTYVKNLSITVHVWRHIVDAVADKDQKKILSAIFVSLSNILAINTELLDQLQRRMQTWCSDQSIGDVISNLTPYLKMYQIYPSSYDDVVGILQDLDGKDKKFTQLLSAIAAHPLAEGKSFASFLILPVQRVPRYVLLLADLIKNTDKEHPDYTQLEDSLSQMQSVADSINLAMITAERTRKLLEIQKLFEDIEIMLPHRQFIMDGLVHKQCRKEIQKRYDCLIYGKKNTQDPIANAKVEVSGQLSLLQMIVIDVPDSASHYVSLLTALEGHENHAFQIQGPGKSFLAYAETHKEKQEWLNALTKAIEEEIERSSKDGKNADPLDVAPVWVPDEIYKNCPLCDTSFTVIFRKHHCRKCGTVVCGDCSKQKLFVPTVKNNKKVRVCDRCFALAASLEAEEGENNPKPKVKKAAPPKEKEKPIKKEKSLDRVWTLKRGTSQEKLSKSNIS